MSQSDPFPSAPRVKELFARAGELSPDERRAFLDAECGDDAPLRSAVESLLAALERAGEFLSGPTMAPSIGAIEAGAGDALDAPASRRIGPYKLLQVIGEGGFGTVYLAEQEHPVRRRVALKLIKLGMDTKQVIARFEAERQALALMDHPNIARVFDAGATLEGRPYFVMELVKGEPITRYCDANRLTPKQRIELFIPVCQAVQHAHQKGVIHRDIKPGNVLVTLHDGKPVPKVIDFGIAKATQARLTEKTLFTEFKQLIGTPEYMSPEQAEMSGLDVDTRSDVYSLGVLLYELLIGATPFDARELRSKAYAEMQRVIREVDPPRPSTRLSTLATLPNVASQRSTEPAKLGAMIRGELDWIVMKCLEKDRARRYESPSALAVDLAHHLADEPVSASPQSALYRLRKSARRHRVAMLVASITFIALLLGLLIAIYGLRESRQSEARVREALIVAEQRRREAETANETTAAVSQFLADTLQSADPLRGAGKDVTVAETIDAAVKELGDRFRDRPLVEAQLRQTIGITYNNLGRAEIALPQLQAAYDLRRRALGDDAAATIAAQIDLATVLTERSETTRAESLYRDALSRAQRQAGADDPLTLQVRESLALLLVNTSRISEGRKELEDVLRLRRATAGPDHPDVANAMSNVAYAVAQAGETKDAVALYREAVDVCIRASGVDHPSTLGMRMSLAANLENVGQLDEAERIERDLLERQRRVLPADHPDVLYTLNALGNTLYRQERIDEAEAVLTDLADRMDRAYRPDAFEPLVVHSSVAYLMKERGKFDEAEARFREIIARAGRSLSDDNIATMRARSNLAGTLYEQGKLDEAEAIYRAEIPRWRAVRGELHHETLVQLRGLGETLEKANRLADAEPIYAELFDAAQRSQDDPRQAGRNMALLGLARVKLGRLAEAEAPLRAAILKMIDAGDTKAQRIGELYEALIEVCEKTGKPDEAARLRAELARIRPPTTLPATSPATRGG